jgi:hypothetical protein
VSKLRPNQPLVRLAVSKGGLKMLLLRLKQREGGLKMSVVESDVPGIQSAMRRFQSRR